MVLLGGYKPFYQLLLSLSQQRRCVTLKVRGPSQCLGGSLQVSRACVGDLVLLETQCKQEGKLARGHQGASYCQ